MGLRYEALKISFEKKLDDEANEELILEKLIHASDEFIQFNDETPDYDSILKTISDISGARYAVLNIFDNDGLGFITVAISGVEENIKKGLSLLGINVINNHWNHDPFRAEKTYNQTITQFSQLHNLTGNIVSKKVVHLIEKTFGIGKTYVVKIAKEDKVLGDFTLLFPKGETMSNNKFVDLYSHQVGMFLDRQKGKNLLRENEARHLAMVSNISDAIAIIGADGVLKYKSPNSEKLFGWKPQDLVGTSGWATVHPDDLERIHKEFLGLLEHENSTKTVEYRYKCKDGSYKLIELTASNFTKDPIIDGVLLNYHNITEKKNFENQIIRKNLLLKAILESSPEVIVFALDKQYCYLAFNQKHKKVIHQIWGKEIAIGLNMLDVIGDHEDRIKAKLNFDRALAGECFVLSEDYGDEKLSRLSWLDYWAPITDDDKCIIGLTCFVLNISEQKKAEFEIKTMNQELRRLNAEKDKFFSVISHDLRSPFNGFLGLTQIMAEDLPSLSMAEIQEIAVSMRSSATNLYHLLENLLQWSRKQQSGIPFNPEPVQIHRIIDESIEIVKESAESKAIKIDIDIPSSLEVYADINMLQCVIRNLVSNAVKFTPKGGKVNASAKYLGKNGVEITVQDSGIGMSKAMVENLFRLDVKTNRRGTDGEPSTGLGLLLCKEFIEKHGGKLWVESKENFGSKFNFIIPNIVGN